jgi:thiamine-phosphate diphosphorylase
VSDRRRILAGDLPFFARGAARAGVDRIQVREKDLGGRELFELVGRVLAAAAGTRAEVLVNGRPDVAEAAGASGVQLPEQGLPVAEVKRAFPGLLVGASRHSVEGALAAEAEGADFVVLGPIFATPGKEEQPLGLEPLRAAAQRLRIPVHAIGGIDATTAPQALAAGARGLAAIRVFVEAPAEDAVRSLRGA